MDFVAHPFRENWKTFFSRKEKSMPKKKPKPPPDPIDVLKEALAAQAGVTSKQVAWDLVTLQDASGTLPDGWIISYLADKTPTTVFLNPQMSHSYTIKEYQTWKSLRPHTSSS